MPRMIQIRNVPDEVHRQVKIRAAEAGLSLSDYLLAEVTALVAVPTRDELQSRLQRQPPLKPARSSAEIIRDEREAP